jgi:hypothetical protein
LRLRSMSSSVAARSRAIHSCGMIFSSSR